MVLGISVSHFYDIFCVQHVQIKIRWSQGAIPNILKDFQKKKTKREDPRDLFKKDFVNQCQELERGTRDFIVMDSNAHVL